MLLVCIKFLCLFIECLVAVHLFLGCNVEDSVCRNGVIMTVVVKSIVCVFEENSERQRRGLSCSYGRGGQA